MSDDAVVIELPSNSDAPAIARRYVTENAVGLPHQLVEKAELLVSELVSNALAHGSPAITLRVGLEPPGIGVFVHDAGDGAPQLPSQTPDISDLGGRGLLLVAALANDWGVTPSHPLPGKTVWFRLDSPGPGSAHHDLGLEP